MSLQGQKLKRTKQKDTFKTCFQRFFLLKFNLAEKHDGFLGEFEETKKSFRNYLTFNYSQNTIISLGELAKYQSNFLIPPLEI